MFDIKFNIKETDKIGPRNAVVKGPAWEINIPDRTLTSTEINASFELMKDGVPEFTYPHNCIEVRKKYDAEKLQKISRYNKIFSDELSIVKQYGRPYNDESRFAFFRVDRKIETHITPEQNKALIDLQIEAGFRTLSIHEESPFASAENLGKRIKESLEKIEDARGTTIRYPFVEPMIVLSARCDDSFEFRKKLETSIDNGFKIICIENGRSIHRYHSTYVQLKEFATKTQEVLIIGANTEKTIEGLGSGPHIMNILGQDIVGTRMPQSYFKQGESVYIPSRFDKITGGVLSRGEQEARYGEILGCACPACLNKSRAQFYGYQRKDLLSPACKVHEAFESRELFSETRENIGELNKFIPKKEFLMQSIANIGFDFRQRKLFSSWN